MLWATRGNGRGRTAHGHGHRIAQHLAGELHDRLRHGRREQQGLPVARQLRNDRPHIVDEAHVEHAVGFVEHEGVDAAKPQRIGPDEIEEPSRRRHQNIDAARKRTHLRADRHAANGERRVHPHVPTIGAKARENLARQFAGRAQHEDPAGLLFRPAGRRNQAMQNGQRECRRLAGSGLGDADEVAAAKQDRDRLGLYRGGGEVAFFSKGSEDRLGESERVKGIQ